MKQCVVVFLGIFFCIGTVVHADDHANSDQSVLFEVLGAGVLPGPAPLGITDGTARVFGFVQWDINLPRDGRSLRESMVSEQLIPAPNSATSPIDEDGTYAWLTSGHWASIESLGPGCEVECPSDSFACCSVEVEGPFHNPMCACLDEGSSDQSCDIGGEGSSGCSLEIVWQ